jgi:hypothetical protein
MTYLSFMILSISIHLNQTVPLKKETARSSETSEQTHYIHGVKSQKAIFWRKMSEGWTTTDVGHSGT